MNRLTVVQLVPALEVGGVERGTVEIARALAAAGHRAIVVSAGGRLVRELDGCGAEHVMLDIGAKRLGVLRHVRTLRARLFDWRADVLHARSRLPAWIGWRAAQSLPPAHRPAFVTTVHGPYTVNPYSAIMVRGDAVIAISEFIGEYVRRNYPRVDPSRLHVVPRGIDHARYAHGWQPEPAWLARWHREFAPADRLIVSQVARLTRWKGQLDFVELIARLRARRLPVLGVMIGAAEPRQARYRAEIEARIAALGLAGSLQLLGDRDDVREILAVSAAAVSLTQEPEAFGRTTLEALTLGTPVVGYAHGATTELLTRLYPRGLVEVGAIDAAADRLAGILQSRDRVPAHAHYALETMCARTLAVYGELAAARHARVAKLQSGASH